MSIIKKLTLAFALMTAVIVALSVCMMVGFSSMKSTLSEVIQHSARKRFLAARFEADVQAMRAAQRGLELYSIAKNETKTTAAKQTYLTRSQAAADELVQLNAAGLSPDEAELVHQSASGLDDVNQYLTRLIALCESGDSAGAANLSASYTSSPFEKAAKPALDLVQIESARLTQQQAEARAKLESITWIATALILIGLVVAALVIAMIRRVARVLSHMARDLSTGGQQLTQAAAQVANSATELARGASEQAASLQETSAATATVSSMTTRNVQSARSATALVNESAARIDGGNTRLNEMEDSMNAINSSSGKISKIIKTIDEIAFQTNILALNAAVEAARAGESGMGFAVVADEVRSLAQRSARAAQDTSTLIAESIGTSTAGSTKLAQVSKAIVEITHDSTAINALVQQMSAGSEEQKACLDQITRALRQIEQITQQTAAHAEESAAASEQLNAQAESMHSVVEELQVLVHG